jgi:DNA-binding transcriptional LysR family regulator
MQGVGLAQVPGPLVRAPIAAGRLEPVLDDRAVMTPGVFLYHPGKRQMLPKLRAFIDHIKAAAR